MDMPTMNKNDQRRKDDLIKTLSKAREQAADARLYLTANNRNPEDIYAASDVLDHIDNALERLGALAPTY